MYMGLRCDLLSILGIFDIAITKDYDGGQIDQVVICFQFWVSLTSLSLRCGHLTESQRFIAGDRKKKSRQKLGFLYDVDAVWRF